MGEEGRHGLYIKTTHSTQQRQKTWSDICYCGCLDLMVKVRERSSLRLHHLHLDCCRGMFLLFFSLVGCRWSTCSCVAAGRSCWSPCVQMWCQEEDTREGARLRLYRQVSVLILLSLYISIQCGFCCISVATQHWWCWQHVWLLRFQHFTSCPCCDFWLYCK